MAGTFDADLEIPVPARPIGSSRWPNSHPRPPPRGELPIGAKTSHMVTDRRHLALFLSGLSGGGAQRRMLTLAGAFAARGHRVEVVVPRSRGPFAAQLSPTVRLVTLDPLAGRLPGIGSRRPLLVLAAVPALAGYLRRERPDAVLSTSNPANLACAWARGLAGSDTPLVLSANIHLSAAIARRARFWRPVLQWLARCTYSGADAVIAISRGVADDLPRAAGVPRQRVHAIPNPVAVDEIRNRASAPVDHPWLAPGEPPLLLAVGKLAPQKDYPTLLRAFARLRAARRARLVILGEGAQRGRLARLARRLGIASDVALPGFEPNPHAWMARASVFVLSSAWEGFSNALAEALACGCPVVSTECPSGPAEILDGGAFGPLCPVGDDRALAGAILRVLDAPPSPDALRARAATFSVDAAADRYLEVLLGACRAARRSP
jgi:glycosyltransferase involved in cell wall biosynthesis